MHDPGKHWSLLEIACKNSLEVSEVDQRQVFLLF